VAIEPFEASSPSLRCFFVKLHIIRPSRRRQFKGQQPRRDLSAFTPERIEFLGPNQQLAGAPLSYHRHGYSTTSRLAKDPRRSLQRNLPCQLACRGLLFNLSKAGLYLPGQDPRNFKEVSDLQVSPPGVKFACWALERKCRGCIVVHLEHTRDAFVEARPGREKISRNLLYAHIPHSTPPGFVLLASRIPTFSSSIDFEP